GGARPGDLQAAGRAQYLLGVGPRLGGRGVGRAGLGAAGEVEHRRRVAHRAGDHVLDHETLREVVAVRQVRAAVAGRLQADEAAAGGRDADRAAPVAAVRHRHDAGRYRRGRAARRAADDVAEVPRIAAGAVELAFGRAGDAELGEVGLADRGDAALAVAPHQPAVLRIHHALAISTAGGPRPAGDGDQQVLDQERHAAERPVRQRIGLGPRLVEGLVDDSADLRIVAANPGDRRLDQLAGGHRALADQVG